MTSIVPRAFSATRTSPTPSSSSSSSSSSSTSSIFHLRIFRQTWGLDHHNLHTYLNEHIQAKNKPYVGYEAGLIWLNQQQKHQLKQSLLTSDWISMIFTDSPLQPSDSVEHHIQEFKRQTAEAIQFSNTKPPVLFNVHGGKDSWNQQQIDQYFTGVLSHASTLPIPVVHETHRGRILYNPWITRDLIQRYPNLYLCADLSHWVVVCERPDVLDDRSDINNNGSSILELIAPRVKHIHARVGYENGPQVSDPRAPEFASLVARYEGWWRYIWKVQQDRGDSVSWLTAEYGPHNNGTYQQTLPYTQQPVVNVEDVTDWAAERLAKKFENEKE